MFINVNTTPMPEWFDLVVYCNYKPLAHCFEADDKKGYAICYDVNEDGIVQLVNPKDNLSGFKTVHHRGIVQFRKRDELAPEGGKVLKALPAPRDLRYTVPK